MKGIVVLASLLLFSVIHPQSINLHDTTNQYDYIIITIPGFVNTCESFRYHKETVRNIRTLVVDTSQIFTEFNSYPEPQNNIREFISYAGTYWEEPVPEFVLLAGNIDIIPAFKLVYPDTIFFSDHPYRLNMFEDDSSTIEFHTGRIPVKDTEELGNYFLKVIAYESDNAFSSWMNNSLFLVQDEPYFNFWGLAQMLATLFPDFINNKFFINDSGSLYYGNKDSIFKVINEAGVSIVWFLGADDDSFFISPDYFNLNDLQLLNNSPKYFITLNASCQSTVTGNKVNLNSKMLISPEGSIAGIGFSGITYWGIANYIQELWALRLFDNSYPTLGEVFDLELNEMKSISLWGDPTIKLEYDDLTSTDSQVNSNLIVEYSLTPNYPNPFNPQTKINYSVPVSAYVIIKVFDILGNEIDILVDEEKPKGIYNINWNASGLPSGVYICKMQSGNFIQTRKMLLMK